MSLGMHSLNQLCRMRQQAWCLIGALWVFSAANSLGQSNYLELSLVGHTLAVCGGQNASYAIESSTDLTNWTSLVVANPTVNPVRTSLTATQNTVFFRSVIVGNSSVGMFNKVLD